MRNCSTRSKANELSPTISAICWSVRTSRRCFWIEASTSSASPVLPTRLFNLVASDVGRPISDITRGVEDPELMKDAESVLAELTPSQREVKGKRETTGTFGASSPIARRKTGSTAW